MAEILAIETSAECCSVAINSKDGVLEEFEHAPMKHAELLLPMVDSVLRRASRRLSDLDAIAFGRGPGSFTSLRIGIGAVQGLAWGADIPVVPISSLAATAQSVLNETQCDGELVVALDARMDEIYWSVFTLGDGGIARPICEESVSPPEELLTRSAGEKWHAIGNGFKRFDALSKLSTHAASVHTNAWPTASAVLRLADDWLAENDPLPADQAQPVYLRNNVAEKPKTTTGRSPGQ